MNRLFAGATVALAILTVARTPELLSAGVGNLGELVVAKAACQQNAISWYVAADSGAASPLFEQALAFNPYNTRARARLAELQWAAANHDEALRSWRQVVERDPSDTASLFRLGMAYDRQGMDEMALAAWRQAGSGTVSSYLAEIGIRERRRGDLDGALARFRDAVAVEPSSALANYWLAETYLQVGMLAESEDAWVRAAILYPENDWHHWWALGEAARIRQEWSMAEVAFERGVPLTQEPEMFLRRLGQVHERAWRMASALTTYYEAISAAPDRIDAYLAVGSIQMKLGDLDSAAKWYESTVERFPEDFRPYQRLGAIAYEQERFPGSMRWLKLAHDKAPQNVDVMSDLATSYYANGEVALAVSTLEEAIVLAPQPMPTSWGAQLRQWRSQLN